MFDFDQILQLFKLEPGHNLVQSFLLFMIWMQSWGVKKQLKSLQESLEQAKSSMEIRFQKIEGRMTVLEQLRGK